MKSKIKISKSTAIRLITFAILLAAAVAGDIYLKNNPIDLTEITAQSEDDETDQSHFFAVTSNSSTSSILVNLKLTKSKLLPKFHNKFLQKAHQCKDLQILKEKIKIPTTFQISLIKLIRLKDLLYFSSDTDESLVL